MSFRERKQKYSQKPKVESVKLNFDLNMMNTFCSYCLSENASIHRSSLSGLQELFNKIDEGIFENNQELVMRYRFCKKALETRLGKKLTRKDMILRDIYGLVDNQFSSLDPNNFVELSDTEVDWVEQAIGTSLNMIFINNNAYELQTACSNFINCDYTEKAYYADQLKEKSTNMHVQFRRNELDRVNENDVFDLSNAAPAIAAVQERLNRPSHKLATGMQGLNGILAGGFEGSRVYCFFALPGEGKTITLLNLLYQIKKYNKKYQCKDKTKRPCIVLLTMENKTYEAIATLFNIVCSSESIANYTTDEAMQIMAARDLIVDEDNPINIRIVYRPINSVNTEYLYKMTEDLADEGFEVISVLQDYIKRIRPMDAGQEERFRLGNVINDFRNFASYKDIPVITASQLNREAARIIDECRSSKKNDLVRRLGRANIGESSLIDENLDATIFLTPEWVGEQKYMGFKLTKKRYPIFTKTVSFYQPYAEGSEVKLMEDEGLTKPLYEKSLASNSEDQISKNFGNTIRYTNNRQIRDIDDIKKDLEGELIVGGTSYSNGQKAAFSPRTKLITIVERVPIPKAA